MTGLAAVGETPEDKPVQQSSHLHGPKRTSQTMTRCAVADTVNSSFSSANSRNSQRKKLNSEVAGTCMDVLKILLSTRRQIQKQFFF